MNLYATQFVSQIYFKLISQLLNLIHHCIVKQNQPQMKEALNADHVNGFVVFHLSYAKKKSKEQLMLFKETSTYVAVKTEHEVVVNVLASLTDIN